MQGGCQPLRHKVHLHGALTLVGHSAQHEGKCNTQKRVCYQGRGAFQLLRLRHKVGRSLDGLPAVRAACNVRVQLQAEQPVQLQADLHSFTIPQQGLRGVLMHSVPVLPPLVAQCPVGEGHAPARLAGQGLGVLLHCNG